MGSGRGGHRWGRAGAPEELQRPPCHGLGLYHGLGHDPGPGHGEVGCPGLVEEAEDPCL